MKLVRHSIKRMVQGIALVIAFVPAVLTLFGRLPAVYSFFAQAFALGPGLPGSYLRAAYYKLTLRECSIDRHKPLGLRVSGKTGSAKVLSVS